MKKKTLFAFILMLALAASAACIGVLAADASAQVYVTVANGALMTAREPVTVTDIDGDGALTINDALCAVHEKSYDGGAAAGYATAKGDYGLYITKLWGAENGGSYGYYLNNQMAMSLTDPVKDGDALSAYAFTDMTGFSDTYSYFDVAEYSGAAGEAKTLKLFSLGFDADFNPVSNVVAGAVITVDGKPTDYKTDANGQAEIALSETGTHVISAVSDTMTLVPPVSIATIGDATVGDATVGDATVTEATIDETTAADSTAAETAANNTGAFSPTTGDYIIISVAVAAVVSLGAFIALRRKNGNENKNK